MAGNVIVIYNHIIDYLLKTHGLTLDYNESEDSYETIWLPWNLAEKVIDGLHKSLKDMKPVNGVSMYTKTPVSGSMNAMIIGFTFNSSNDSGDKNHKGVLIKGMKMPKSCNRCRFNESDCWCGITKSPIDRDFYYRERLSDCPIVESVGSR